MALYCFAWFRSGESEDSVETARVRQTLLYTLIICIPGLLLTRILTSTLPFRERPIENQLLHLRLAYHFDPSSFLAWSSFPSDHAVLFFALATGMFLVNRKLGVLLYLHSFFIISLPRVFLGIHYPTDILGGALIGIALAYPARWESVRATVTHPVFQIKEYSPGFFYVCLMFLVYETAGLYWNLVQILMQTSHHATAFLHNIHR
jgi:undecaprenyl-diphosphatase